MPGEPWVPGSGMDVGAYCRDVEAYLCRRNGGHLIRIVGPAFVLVSQWAAQGVPLRVVLHGIDRTVTRLEARGGRRRPVRLEFCEADVLDAFDQWRRAVGPQASRSADATAETAADAAEEPSESRVARRQPSLTRHLERTIERLSSLRASTAMAEAAGIAVDRALAALDGLLADARGARGDARDAVQQHLQAIDEALMQALVEAQPETVLQPLRSRARDELRLLRPRMSVEDYADAERRVLTHALRMDLGLPELVLR